MSWKVEYLPEAREDLRILSKDVKTAVLQAIKKVMENPLPKSENGYGNPLGNKPGSKLSGFLKIKLLKYGIRVVYKLIRTETTMTIVVIGARRDDEVYKIAVKRNNKYDL